MIIKANGCCFFDKISIGSKRKMQKYYGVKNNKYAGKTIERVYNQYFGNAYRVSKLYRKYYRKEFPSCKDFLICRFNLNQDLAEEIIDKNLLHWYPDIHVGDTLNLTIEDGNGSQTKKVEVVAIGDYSIGFTNYNYLLMAKEGANKLSSYNINEVYHIFATTNYDKSIEKSLKELVTSSDLLQMQTWKERYDEWKSALAMTSGACYAFLGILGVICVMNMVNTMIHSVHVRKKEIGMMQAVGMTDRQLVKMLHQEGLFYTVGTLVLSIGLGSILGYPIFIWARNNGMFNISNYHYPITAAVIVSAVMIVIQLLLAIILGKSVRKKTLNEKIRFSE